LKFIETEELGFLCQLLRDDGNRITSWVLLFVGKDAMMDV